MATQKAKARRSNRLTTPKKIEAKKPLTLGLSGGKCSLSD